MLEIKNLKYNKIIKEKEKLKIQQTVKGKKDTQLQTVCSCYMTKELNAHVNVNVSNMSIDIL